MKIAIVETGAPPQSLRECYPGYPAMFERLLGPLAPRLSFSTFSTGALPPVSAFDGMLVTGSPAGVYEGHDWIAPLEALIRDAADARKPTVGVCFGHQIMAQAFGGMVRKSEKGWAVGLHEYDVTAPAPWMTPAPNRIACAVSHQDQVLTAPKTARRLAGSAFCENAILAYDHAPAISFQMHPEFDHAYAADLYRARLERIGETASADALASLRGRSDREMIGRWIANFYMLHAG
jgi:GMP synthase-like glutamine amidotransferase